MAAIFADLMAPPLPPTRDQLLDEVAYVAELEHGLMVDYLLIRYALGAEQPEVTGAGPAADAASAAASAAKFLAIRAMKRLHQANDLLVGSRRRPVLGRAAWVMPETGAPIPLAAFRADQFEGFPRREQAIAAAVERQYAHLEAASASPAPDVDPGLAQEINFFVSFAGSHPVDDLAAVTPAPRPFVTRLGPHDDLDRELAAACDAFYVAIVAAVRASFGNPAEVSELFGRVLATMDALDDFCARLGRRGLLPAFTLPPL